ncbi:MAG: hypothetical protein Q9195_005534 [Heterodermia aff. obscurata]
MFSNSPTGSPYLSEVVLENNQNYNELRDYDRGGPAKTILRPVPLTNARYMLIDWLNPFRAIYFPLAHQAGAEFEDLCVYLMIDFRLRQGVQMRNHVGDFVSLTFDRERGLTYRHSDTLCFDLKGIYDYLILPQQLRAPEKGLYRTATPGEELITLLDNRMPRRTSAVTTIRRQFVRHIDLVTVINDNFGVDVTWQPYQHSVWVFDFLIHVTEIALGFVPGVGPLLAVSFSIGMQIIIDPDGFREQNPLNLAADIIEALINSGGSSRGNLPQAHQRSGAMFLVSKGGSGERAEPERPYVKNLGLEPWNEDEGEELVEQQAEGEDNLPDESKGEDHWEEAVEQQGTVEGEEAAKQGAEDEEKQNAESEAKDEGEKSVEQAVTAESNPNTEQKPEDDANPIPEVKTVDEVKPDVEKKADDEENQVDSVEVGTEKKLGGEQDGDSKEASIPEHTAGDQGDQTVEPKTEDGLNNSKEAKADEANQITSDEVETEKKSGDEQVGESKETAIPVQEAKEQEDPAVEPKAKDEEKDPEKEKTKDEGEQSTKQDVKDEDEGIPESNVEDEAKLAAEPKVETEGKELVSEESHPPKQNVEDEDKAADPGVQDEKTPAAEPEVEKESKEPVDEKAVSEENQPATQKIKEEDKAADPGVQDEKTLAAEPEDGIKTVPEPDAQKEPNAATEPKVEVIGEETADKKVEEGHKIPEPDATTEANVAAEPKAKEETADKGAEHEGKTTGDPITQDKKEAATESKPEATGKETVDEKVGDEQSPATDPKATEPAEEKK